MIIYIAVFDQAPGQYFQLFQHLSVLQQIKLNHQYYPYLPESVLSEVPISPKQVPKVPEQGPPW